MEGSKGQTSVEFLVLLAVGIVVLSVIVIIASGQTGDLAKIKEQNEAKNAVLDLSAAAKEVYAQGEGAKKQVYVIFPSSYEPSESYVSGKAIKLRARETDFVSEENFDVHGFLPGSSGAHWVWVISEGNKVRIGSAMISLSKNSIYLIINKNSSATDSVDVISIWPSNINVSGILEWNNENVTLDAAPLSFSLSPNQVRTIGIETVANEQPVGFYNGKIDFTATDGMNSETVELPITVEVVSSSTEFTPPLTVEPSLWNESMVQNSSTTKLFQICTNSETSVDSVSFNPSSGNPGSWITTLEPLGPMGPNACEEKVLGLYVSANATPGLLTGYINVIGEGTEGAEDSIMLEITVEGNVSDTLGPIVTNMVHSEWPTTLTNISVGGLVTDEYTGNNNIEACNIKIDSGLWMPLISTDGNWDSPAENFTYSIGPMGVGYHTIYYQCQDSAGNWGGVYSDIFGVVDVDLMLVLDRSGSMAWYIVNYTDSSTVSTTSSNWANVKSLGVSQKNGELANLSVQIRAGSSGCTAYYNATINGTTVATGSRTSTSYGILTTEINISQYEAPYTVDLWLKRSSGGCTVYNQILSVFQPPTKMEAVKNASKSFLDIAGNNIQAGLVSYSTGSTLDKTLQSMSEANQLALKAAIDALNPSGSTCIECGLTKAADELTSTRARPLANKVIVLLTDGVGNVGDSVDGAVYCRNRNVTVYTIGFGYDVDSTELTNIALLTYGDYYFAPDAQTLNAIFQSIGR